MDGSKCIKFEIRLRTKIKQGIRYQEIRRFLTLVNKYRIYDEDYKAHSTHYKSVSERKGNNQFRGNHTATMLMNARIMYRGVSSVDHISTNCQKPKKAQSGGKVFALNMTNITCVDHLIRGTCIINSIPFIVIIDTGATHSSISLKCAKRLDLKLSSMDRNMIIDTPTLGSVTTSWLEFKHVHINCSDKTVSIPEFDAINELFVSAKEGNEFVKDDVAMFRILASMKAERKDVLGEFPVVFDFPEV
ncbi:uncharacterized protein LOC127129952 [Lathyrus oleraceus]|uniref:uncharacterized protein LOC127129952 n=1 Tax=Pisum sativum TaxID=3888 RepID=UPI0021D30170|nr:uncharacterized protein LOC127129952 [Pisum sativum]